MSFGRAAQGHITTWRCSAPPHAVVEVLQSSSTLLAFITKTCVSGDGGGGSPTPSPPPPTTNRRLLVLFPGNPGIVLFYKDFARILSEEYSMDVLVMGFAGHSLDDHNHGRLFSLQDQIDVADQFMHALLDSSSINRYTGNVYVGGHSIGGYVAVQMLARHRESIKLYFGLCPVISRIMASPNGRAAFFWGIPILQWVVALLGSLFAVLPYGIRRHVVRRHAPTLDPGVQEAIAQRITRAVLMNAFFLTFDEFRCVIQPDKLLLRSVQEKMCLYYVPLDGWAPPEHANEIRQLCPRLKSFVMEADEGIPHAWCLRHSGAVVERAVAKHIQ